MDSIRPFSVPFTGWLVAFFNKALAVRCALSFPGESTLDATAGYRTATGPLVTISTLRHNPMFLSGGAGFQSTKVMAKSVSAGAQVCTASTFACPGFAASVILNS